MEEELLPPPPKKGQVTDDLLPPPPKKSSTSLTLETPEQIKATYSTQGAVSPQVQQAFKAPTLGKKFSEEAAAASQWAQKVLTDWETARIKQLQPLIKTDADVQKYTELFKKEQEAKKAELQSSVQSNLKPLYDEWEAASKAAPIPKEPSFLEGLGIAAKAANPEARLGVDLLRSAASYVTDQIPQNIYGGIMSDYPTDFDDLISRLSIPQRDGGEFVNYKDKHDQFRNWFNQNQGRIISSGLNTKGQMPKIVKQFYDETYGEGVYEKEKREITKSIIAKRVDLEAKVEEQKRDAGSKLTGATQSLKDVESLGDFASLVGTLGGQAVPQVAVTLLTRGAGTFLQEKATIYDQQIDKLAAERGITRQEVIEQGLDDPASGELMAALAAGLDYVSAGRITNLIKQGTLQRALTVAGEGATEAAQGVAEETGAALGKNVKESPFEAFKASVATPEGLERRGTEFLGGIVGATAIGSLSRSGKAASIANELGQNLGTVAQAQDIVFQEAVTGDLTPNTLSGINEPQSTQTTPDQVQNQTQPNAIQITPTGQIPVQPEATQDVIFKWTNQVGRDKTINGEDWIQPVKRWFDNAKTGIRKAVAGLGIDPDSMGMWLNATPDEKGVIATNVFTKNKKPIATLTLLENGTSILRHDNGETKYFDVNGNETTPPSSQENAQGQPQAETQAITQEEGQVKPRIRVQGEIVEPNVYGEAAEFPGDTGIGVDLNNDTKALAELKDQEFVDKARNLIQQGVAIGRLNEEQVRNLQAKLNNTMGKNYNVRSAKAFRDELRRELGLPVTVITTDVRQRIEGLKAVINGVKWGTKNATGRLQLLKDQLANITETLKIPANKKGVILNKALSLNLGSDLQLSRLQKYIENLAERIPVDEQYTEAKELRSKININKISGSQKAYVQQFSTINPNDVDNIQDYLDVARNIVDAQGKGTLTDRDNKIKIGLLEQNLKENKIAELEELGVPTDGLQSLSLKQLDNIASGIDERVDEYASNAKDTRAKEARDKAIKATEYSMLGLGDDAYANNLKQIDLSLLKTSDVLKVKKDIDNYIQNGVKSLWASSLAKSQQGISELLKDKAVANFDQGNQSAYKIGGTLDAKLNYMTGEFKKVATKIMRASGMAGVTKSFAKAKNETAKLEKRYDDLRKSLGLWPKTLDLLLNPTKRKEMRELEIRQGVLDAMAFYPDEVDANQQFRTVLNTIEDSYTRSQDTEIAKKLTPEFVDRQKVAYEFVTQYPTSSREEWLAAYKADKPKEFKLWEFRKKEMKPLDSMLKQSTEEYHNKVYRGMEDYSGKLGVKTLGKQDAVPELTHVQFNPDGSAKIDLVNSAYERKSKLQPNQFYTFDSTANFLRGYQEVLADYYATPYRVQTREFFSDPRITQVFGDNLETIKSTFFGMDKALASGNIEVESEQSRKIREGEAWKALNLLVRSGKTALLNSPSRYILQSVPLYLDLLVQTKGDVKTMFKAAELLANARGKQIPLFDEIPLGQRGAMLGGAGIGDKEFAAARKSIALGRSDELQDAIDKFNEKSAFGQAIGDIHSAKLAWVTFYLEALKQQGITDFDSIDLTTEHEQDRGDAVDYANLSTNILAGPSQMEEMPAFLRSRNLSTQAIRNIVFYLSSFTTLQKARVADALFTLKNGGNKEQAIKDLVGVGASTTAWAFLSLIWAELMASAGGFILKNIFGAAGSEKEKEEKNMLSQVLTRGAYDWAPFTMIAGQLSDDAFKYMADGLWYFGANPKDKSYTEWKKDGGGFAMPPVPKDVYEVAADRLGPYGTALYKPYQLFKEGQQIQDNKYVVGDQEYYLSPSQQNAMTAMMLFDLATVLNIDQADFKKMRTVIKNQIKENAKRAAKQKPSDEFIPDFNTTQPDFNLEPQTPETIDFNIQ